MKKTLILILSVILCAVNTISCKKVVDYNYPTTFVYNNLTGHTIDVKIESHYTPMEFTLTPGEQYSETKVIGFGPVPFNIHKAEVIYDGTYQVIHLEQETDCPYRNICDIENYVKSSDPQNEHGSVMTFTFTDDDYDYAVSADK